MSPEELERYARHIVLKEIGGPGQGRLRAAHVALIGAGALGGAAALYLAAAGVGRMTLIDADAVSLSNLQRQTLFSTEDVGRAKVDAAAARLTALNPTVAVTPVNAMVGEANAAALLSEADIVLDGCDDFPTRFAVNAACHALGVPLVSGAVGRWDGQVGVFASGLTRGLDLAERAACYRCFVPEAPPEAETCAAVGIVGALTGVIGSMMALEAIKLIVGAGDALVGRVLLYDGLAATTRVAALPPDPACATCGTPQGASAGAATTTPAK